jgi:hypothetical protein
MIRHGAAGEVIALCIFDHDPGRAGPPTGYSRDGLAVWIGTTTFGRIWWTISCSWRR